METSYLSWFWVIDGCDPNHQFLTKTQWYNSYIIMLYTGDLRTSYSLLGFFSGIKTCVGFAFDSERHLKISSFEDPRVMLMFSSGNLYTKIWWMWLQSLFALCVVYLLVWVWQTVFCISVMAMPPFSSAIDSASPCSLYCSLQQRYQRRLGPKTSGVEISPPGKHHAWTSGGEGPIKLSAMFLSCISIHSLKLT